MTMPDHTLVVHPIDPTTDFLRPIYESLDAEVVTGGVTRGELRRLIERADKVVLLGHGCHLGLFAVDAFPEPDLLIVDGSFAHQLRERQNLFIFCYAAQFSRAYGLPGLSTGMFVSEQQEAEIFLDQPVSDEDIAISNDLFAEVVGRFARHPASQLMAALDKEYGSLASSNDVIAFNYPLIEVFPPRPSASFMEAHLAGAEGHEGAGL
jgi:hypothetical protein